MFESLNISGSGMELHKYWMDAISDNVANINTVRPTSEKAFQARYVLARSVEDGGTGAGVEIAGIELGSEVGRLVSDPANQVRIKPDQKLVFARNWPTPNDRLKGAAAILSRLAKLAENAA
jgi:flagellar basal body rod protein FlgC